MPSCQATSVVARSSRTEPLGATRPPQAAAVAAWVTKTPRTKRTGTSFHNLRIMPGSPFIASVWNESALWSFRDCLALLTLGPDERFPCKRNLCPIPHDARSGQIVSGYGDMLVVDDAALASARRLNV